tara:strand:- start:289 stop:495 length:207 start_codon:yes stop_codon:yes gene_type:complete
MSREGELSFLAASNELYLHYLSKMAQALAYEGRETLDTLADTDYYLWFIETWGTEKDMERAEIQGEEE